MLRYLEDGMIGKVHNPMQRYTYRCTTSQYTIYNKKRAANSWPPRFTLKVFILFLRAGM